MEMIDTVNGPFAGVGLRLTPTTTGRYLVLLNKEAPEAGVRALESHAGISMTGNASESGIRSTMEISSNTGTFFPAIGVAVVNAEPASIKQLGVQSLASDEILAVEPERIVHATGTTSFQPALTQDARAAIDSSIAYDASYLHGYRDAVNQLISTLLRDESKPSLSGASVAASSPSSFTWGLQTTKAATSRYTGRGVRVAVLDTGLELSHSDFKGRIVVSKSFLQTSPTAQDGHGHGTHCIGTSCGPKSSCPLPGYGIASDAEIYVGKVLNDQGNGVDSDILAGIDWAMQNQCAIVSMSLGSRVSFGESYSTIFEEVAKRALASGTVLIAAAGNDSYRPANTNPVGHPANCPSVLAISAVSQDMQVASFSNAGLNPQGGQVDFAAPGVQVYSSWILPKAYNTISGTSMATPHVAGIAALWAEARPDARGSTLVALMMQNALRLSLPSTDVGAGLIQAP